VNTLQGTAGAFSRPMAMQWDTRSGQIVANGLGTITDRNPWAENPVDESSDATISQGIARLCQVKDGPSVIVAPKDLTHWFRIGDAELWKPVHSVTVLKQDRVPTFERVDQFTVVRCAPGLGLAG
jgi:hypothetical protein